MSFGGGQSNAFFWLILAAFIVSLAAGKLRIPYPLALVVTGLALGMTRVLPKVHLEPHLFLTVFLPPLLFEGAMNLPVKALKRDWKPIAIYSLAGTVLSMLIVGELAGPALKLPLGTAFVFGAAIAATDPIAVLAIFRRLKADARLATIIEAESLFNDGVAAVLFAVTTAIVLGAKYTVGSGVAQFAWLTAGGIVVGLAIGLLATRLHLELDDHLVEITLTTVVAYGSYVTADAIGASGVMAVIASGLIIGNYGMPAAMNAATREAVHDFWEYAAFVVNSIVFLLIGIEVSLVRWLDSVWLAAGAVVIVLAGRSPVYPLSLAANHAGSRIPLAWQHILFWGGLRGALSMALVLGLDARFPDRDKLIAATFAVVSFSLLVQGFTMGPLLKLIKDDKEEG